MKQFYLALLTAAFFISSCSTYKNTQTPDDVYYSPGSGSSGNSYNSGTNSDYYSTANDQYVRMRVQDPARWSYFDDYSSDAYYPGSYYSPYSPYGSFGFNSYGYGGLGFGFGYYSPLSYWNSFYSWNSFYNPYYGAYVINNKAGAAYGYNQLRTFSPASYSNQGYIRSARPAYSYGQTIQRNYNSSNGVYSRPASGYRPQTNYYSQPSRNYSPSIFSGGNNSGGSFRSSGGGGSISRPSHR